MPDLATPAPPPTNVNMLTPQGQPVEVPAGDVEILQRQGYRPESTETAVARVGAETRAAQTSPVEAFGQAAASTATFGGSDVLQRAIGGEDARIYLQQLEQYHPDASFAGGIAGALLPGATGIAARAGKAVASLGEGAGLLGRTGAAAAGGAVEGAMFGAGQSVHELALSDDPLTLEHAASTLSSNMLYGGVAGGIGGGAFHLAGEGLKAAKGALDDVLLKRSGERAMQAVDELEAQAATEPGAAAAADVSKLDAKGLREAEKAEIEAIDASKQPRREAFVDELAAAHQAREPMKDWLAMTGDRNPDKYTREAAKVVFKQDVAIRNALDDRLGLAARPELVASALRKEAQALETLENSLRSDVAKYRQAAADAPRAVREELLANKVDGYRFGKGGISPTSPMLDKAVDDVVAARFPRAGNGGLILPKELAPFEDHSLSLMRGRNRDLQNTIKNLSLPPASPRLAEINAAREELGVKTAAPVEQSSPLGHMLKAAAHVAGGPLATVASTAVGAIGGLKKFAAQSLERAGRATSDFMGAASKVAAKAEHAAPLVATKILGHLRYGEQSADAEQPKTLPDLYRARTDEVKQQVQMAPDGSFQMRPAARQAMAARLSGLGTVDPVAADRIETAGARRIAWLASQIPRRPDLAGMQMGPDTWHPPDLEMRSWARKAAAADDLPGVLERAVHGTVTPEDAMAMHALGPEMLRDFVNGVSAKLPELQKTLPYERRVSLSMLSGEPVDPAMDPRVMTVLQSQFTDEPGSMGGTMAPKPQPQFGSVAKSLDQPTRAQTRAQGAP